MEEINNIADFIAEARQNSTPKKRLQELASLSDELAEVVAQNVAAPPDLLSKLATHNSKAVRKAVTSNPKTPKKILFNLGVSLPQELLENSIFDFSLLGDLSYIKKIPDGVLSILVQQNNVPRFLLNYAANHPAEKVSDTARMHVNISGEMTEGWHEVVAINLRKYSFVNKFINDFHGIIWDFRRGARVYGDFETPQRSFRRLTNFHEFTQAEVLFNSQMAKRNLAKNRNTTLIVLEQLALDEDYYIRWDVGENPNTPAETLRLLAEDSDSRVRNSVAGNRNTPIEILRSFATVSDIEILYRLAGNPSTPAETLELLIRDRNNSILRAVAGNPSTPAAMLAMLTDDSEDWFDEYVANNFNQHSDYTRRDVVSREYGGIVENIAKNPSIVILNRNLIKQVNCNISP